MKTPVVDLRMNTDDMKKKPETAASALAWQDKGVCLCVRMREVGGRARVLSDFEWL